MHVECIFVACSLQAECRLNAHSLSSKCVLNAEQIGPRWATKSSLLTAGVRDGTSTVMAGSCSSAQVAPSSGSAHTRRAIAWQEARPARAVRRTGRRTTMGVSPKENPIEGEHYSHSIISVHQNIKHRESFLRRGAVFDSVAVSEGVSGRAGPPAIWPTSSWRRPLVGGLAQADRLWMQAAQAVCRCPVCPVER